MDRAIPARKAVEHYGANESGGIVINVSGLDSITKEEPVEAEYQEIYHEQKSVQ